MLTKEKIYLIEEQTGVRQNELRRSFNEDLSGGARKGPQQSAAGLYRDGYAQGYERMGNDGNMYYLNHQRMGKNNKMTAKWVKVKNTQPKKNKGGKKMNTLSWGVEIQQKKAGKKNDDNLDLDDYDSDEDDISSPKKKGLKCNDAGECIDCCDEGLKGDITDYKKYCNRNSPPYAANHYKCQGTTKEGNDGNKYKSTENKNGVYTWKKIKEKKPLKKKSGKVYGQPPTSIQMSQRVLNEFVKFVGKDFATAIFKKHGTPYNSAFKKKNKVSDKDTVYVITPKFKLEKAKKVSETSYIYDPDFIEKCLDILDKA